MIQWLMIGLMLSASSQVKSGFAIFLFNAEKEVQQLLVSETDVVAYNWETHTITLTEEAVNRLKNLEIKGGTFYVYINRRMQYEGEILTMSNNRGADITPVIKTYDGQPRTLVINADNQLRIYYNGYDFDFRDKNSLKKYLKKKGLLAE